MKKKLLLTAGITTIIMWAIDFVAGKFYLYWTVRWLDNVTHFLGGLSVGFLIIWFISLFKKTSWTQKEIIIWTVVGVMLVGFSWEVFEYVLNIAGPSAGETYTLDTTMDLLSDFIGSLVAGYWIIKNILEKYV